MKKVARDIMHTAIVSVRPSDKLLQVEGLLVEANIGGAPVMDGDRMLGIVSRSDFVRVPVLLQSLDSYVKDELRQLPSSESEAITPFAERFADMVVSDVMTTQIQTCDPDTVVAEIADRMVRHHVHRLIVVQNQQPVGIVESLDLVALLRET